MSKAKEFEDKNYPEYNKYRMNVLKEMNHKTLEDVNDKVKARFNEILEEQNVDNSYEITRVLERTQCQTLDWVITELEKLKL